ncbi:hypothetical protein T12_15820 [Trichinella patagoniensis]|uniref:Uncharacterized protein n=1 Tax=Trichinella patagoniensis TaxID=990121 RepID=A0A0V0Z2T8_9BILA|nr:hypothetical protein T12_15820 [Trichinella patagoniensis]
MDTYNSPCPVVVASIASKVSATDSYQTVRLTVSLRSQLY